MDIYNTSVIARAVTSSAPLRPHAFFEEGTIGSGGGGDCITYGITRYKEELGSVITIQFLATVRYRGWWFTLEYSPMTHTQCYAAFNDELHFTFGHCVEAHGKDALQNLCKWLQKQSFLPAGELTVHPLTEEELDAVRKREIAFRPPPVAMLNVAMNMNQLQLTKGEIALMVFHDPAALLHWYYEMPPPAPSVRMIHVPVSIIKETTVGFPQDTPNDATMVGVAFSAQDDYSDCRLVYWATLTSKTE